MHHAVLFCRRRVVNARHNWTLVNGDDNDAAEARIVQHAAAGGKRLHRNRVLLESGAVFADSPFWTLRLQMPQQASATKPKYHPYTRPNKEPSLTIPLSGSYKQSHRVDDFPVRILDHLYLGNAKNSGDRQTLDR